MPVMNCPCFGSKSKQTINSIIGKEACPIDSVSCSEVSSNAEKGTASPLKIPPSPRFSMSPRPNEIKPIHLTLNQIIKATQNFAPSSKIGRGGYGTVYRAKLEDGQVVAVKRAKKELFDKPKRELEAEVEMLVKIEHRNLVKLLCYVEKPAEHLIVTEYVSNGTLRDHLDGYHGRILDFSERLEISIDVAHALTYLHLYAENPIIHRGVKSSNILLTERMRAKVADFEFARLGPTDAGQSHILTKVKGTIGYLDPEYLRTNQLSPKSDVYSFGILLLEILTGRRPVELKRPPDERVTVRWAFDSYTDGRGIARLVDPVMKDPVDSRILFRMFGLAIQCAAPRRADRPHMKAVGEQLWDVRKEYLKSTSKGPSTTTSVS